MDTKKDLQEKMLAKDMQEEIENLQKKEQEIEIVVVEEKKEPLFSEKERILFYYNKPFEIKTCVKCCKTFETRIESQKFCQQCIDDKKCKQDFQKTTERKCLATYIVKNFLPKKCFQIHETGNRKSAPALRAIFKGKDGGEVSWQGRMDVFVSTEFYKNKLDSEESLWNLYPTIARMRIMEVTKQSGNKIKYEDTGKERSFSQTRTYIVLEPLDETQFSEEDLDGELIYVQARSKYTLKGLGRQYSSFFRSDDCVWSYSMSCSCRSGRVSVESILAVVNKENPLVKVSREDGNETLIYFPAEAEDVNVI